MLIMGAWYVTLLSIFFVVVCLFMMLVILIQKPRGGGLSGAFGGGGGSAQAAFGAKTGDVLTWFTVICFAAFVLAAMGLTLLIQPTDPGLEASFNPDDVETSPAEPSPEDQAAVVVDGPEGAAEVDVSDVPQDQPETSR